MPRLTLDKTELHPGDTLTVTVANAPAESDRVQIWTSGTCCRGLPAMDAVGLGTPKDGDIPLTAPQKPADYYVVLLGTPQEPDGSPHIITQSVEFHVLQCLPGEQVCAPAGTDTRWFYDTDAIGSVRLITDDGGGTVARYDYAPFGEPTLAENPDNQRRFAGKEFDAESRLNYFGARYFAAELGRFTAADPGAADGDPLNPQSWNAYAYSRNNPLRFVDPLGTCSVDDAGNLVEDNESSSIVYGGPCLRYSDSATVTPSGPTFHDYYAGLFATFATLTTSFQTIADAVIPSVCGGGGFGYGGVGLGAGRVHGEVLGLVQYDSQSGGAHGGLLGIGAGHFTGGFESMRTWNDWQTHTGPIALGGVEIPGASRQFGKKIDVHSRDIGGLAQYDDGNLSLGLYSGITLGSRRTFGGGAYVTLSWSGCR
jgi:RHS repeat-associated protein